MVLSQYFWKVYLNSSYSPEFTQSLSFLSFFICSTSSGQQTLCFNICGSAFYGIVLRSISGLYLLMWKPLTPLSNSSCGQFLKAFLFWKLFDRCVCYLWPALLGRYVVLILTQLGSECKRMINVNSSCKLGQCESSSLSKTVDVDGILLSECY